MGNFTDSEKKCLSKEWQYICQNEISPQQRYIESIENRKSRRIEDML